MRKHNRQKTDRILPSLQQSRPLWLLVIGMTVIFAGRTWMAQKFAVPRLFDLMDAAAVLGSLIVVIRDGKVLRKQDVYTAAVLGALVAVVMYFASLYSAYPVFGIVRSRSGIAAVRGTYTAIALLGGTAVMRLAGPVTFHATNLAWVDFRRNLRSGLSIGFPLAVLNVFALQMSQGHPIAWQNPWSAVLDALQPGIVEEAIYRFALLGLFWLVLRKSIPRHASWVAGMLVMLVHNFAHYDALVLENPLAALGMGLLTAVMWGVPLTFLALRKGLDAAITFHWLQDAVRFLAGF